MRRAFLYLFASLVLAFLFLPSFIVVPMSVTESIFLHFPPQGFTWAWYKDYFGVAVGICCAAPWPLYTIITMQLAIAVVLVVVPIGALTAYGLSRSRFWGRNFLHAFIVSPLVVPLIVTAIALFFFLSDSMPFLLKSPSGLSVPVWGEFALIFLAIGLGAASIGLLIFGVLYRKPRDEWGPNLTSWYERLRPWAPITLVLTAAYLLLPWWFAYTEYGADKDMLSMGDPYPKVPVVSAGLVLAHVMLTMPIVTIILVATLSSVRRRQDQAAAILGAGPLTTLTRVVLPQMKLGLAMAIVLSILVSLNELLLAVFLSTRWSYPLSKQLFVSIRTNLTPEIAVASTFLIFFTIFLLGAAFFVYRRSDTAKPRPT